MVLISERTALLVLGVLLIFLAFNYDSTIGLAFAVMLAISALSTLRDKNVSIPIQRHPSVMRAFIIGMIGYLIFLGICTVVIPSLRAFDLSSIIDLYSSASQPFFAENKWITLASFGFVIAFIESIFFFGVLPEGLTDMFGINWSWKNPRFWGVVGLIMFTFVVMHITAKKTQATAFNEAMVLIAIFALVSMVIVYITKEILPAAFFHVIANTTSVLDAYGIMSSSYVVYGGIGLALVAVIFWKYFDLRITRGLA